MKNIIKSERCSFNKDARILFNKKQHINNSNKYTDEEKKILIRKLNTEISKLLELEEESS